MAGHRTGGTQCKATTVLIRTDILSRALDGEIDISSECNRALAERLGIDFSQQTIRVEDPVKPVIIAQEPAARDAPGGNDKPVHERPVLNAEDPATPAHLKRLKKVPLNKRTSPQTAAKPASLQQGDPDRVQEPQEPSRKAASGKKERRTSGKKGKDTQIHRFMQKNILRTEHADAAKDLVTKDELYEIFLRWCRAESITPVMDKRAFSVALKNRFVLEDVIINGTAFWKNIRLRR